MRKIKRILHLTKDSSGAPSNPGIANEQIYKDLNTEQREVRVLEVEAGASNDPIRCRLKHVSLLATPKPVYETISYVWGDKTKRGIVYILGRPVDVPATAEIALRRMRHATGSRVLWIDSVCINQDDSAERSEQVAIMHKIYQGGSRNLIWLGEDDECTEQALSDIRRVVAHMRSRTNDFQDVKTVIYDNIDDSKTPLIDIRIKHTQDLRQFYSNKWFSRLWVVQEAALSAVNHCFQGAFEFPLDDVLRAAIWLGYKSHHLTVPVSWAAYMAGLTDRKCGFYYVYAKDDQPFFQLLAMAKGRDATDPRDHIYGLLGLVPVFIGVEEIPTALMPNYQAPLVEVFRNATKFAIIQERGLTALKFANNSLNDDDCEWPSWVPRWDAKYGGDEPVSMNQMAFTAHNEHPLDLSLLEVHDANILPVKGLVVDSITDETPVMRISTLEELCAKERLADLVKPIQAAAMRMHRTADESMRAIACTLIASQNTYFVRLTGDECVELYESYLQYIDTFDLQPPIHDSTKPRSEAEVRAQKYQEAITGGLP